MGSPTTTTWPERSSKAGFRPVRTERIVRSRSTTLIGSPEVLLLDEPTSALDPESSEFLLDSIQRLRAERGITVILSTHRLHEAVAVADEAVRLSGGTVEEIGEASDVLA